MKGKSLKIISIALLVISVIIGVCFYVFNGDNNSMVSAILNWAYVLIALAIVLVLVMPLFCRSGRGSKRGIVELGLLVVLLVISYLFASGNEVNLAGGVANPSHAVLKLSDTVLILAFLLLIIAFLAAIFGGLYKGKGAKINK